jgi:membrane protein YqaA with SNARE-associated domain
MTTKKKTLITWILSAGLILAGMEVISLLYPEWGYRQYFHYFVYMSLSNSFIPLPTNPLIIYMGREFLPIAVAILGAVGTSVANTTEYLVLGVLLENKRVKKVKETATYLALKRYFETSPFLLMIVVNFFPIPIDPIRWMAISVDYPRWRYVLSTFLGRFPRYFLLAWLGDRYNLSNRTILIILAATILVVLVKKGWPYLRRKKD